MRMMQRIVAWFALLLSTLAPAYAADILELAMTQQRASTVIADTLWDLAELGYLEQKSSQTLQNYLAEREFTITSGVADIPTAFVAQYGRGGPTIALLAEFDALPGQIGRAHV